LVGRERFHGTIGGGHLEHVALSRARELLQGGAGSRLDRFPLGAALGQCCGGIVELWFERHDAGDITFFEEALHAREHSQRGVLATSREGATPERHRLLTLEEASREGAE